MTAGVSTRPTVGIELDLDGATADELRAEIRRLRAERTTLLRHTSDGYWDWYIQTSYEYMSPRFWEILGVDHRTKRHDPAEWQDLVHRGDLAQVMKTFDSHVKSRGVIPYDQRVRYRHAEGHWVTVRCRGQVIEWDDDGSPVRMVGTHTDLTPFLQAQERAEILLSSGSVGIWDWVDIDSDSEYWTPEFFRLLGYVPGEITPSVENFKALLHPDDVAPTFALVTKHFAGEAEFDTEYRLRHKSGEYRWFHGRGEAVFDEEGQPRRMVGAIQDIHGRKIAMAELQRANRDLEQFSYFVSHDLRAPLRHITSFLELLKDEAEGTAEERREWMEFAAQGATRMHLYIDDVLRFARSGQAPPTEPTPLHEAAEIAVAIVSRDADRPIRVEVAPLPVLVVNRTHIERVFQNLFENARRYTPPDRHPSVRVFAEQSGEGTRIFVQDNGRGIEESMYERIFQPFERGHGAGGGGSGLGLAMCRRALQHVGATIAVYASSPEGTTFALDFAPSEGGPQMARDPIAGAPELVRRRRPPSEAASPAADRRRSP